MPTRHVGIDEASLSVDNDAMDDQRRKELIQRREELLKQQTGPEGTETRRQDAEDRVTMCVRAQNTPGFPKPLQAEIESAERDLREATDECDRINEQLRDIDKDLGIL